VSECLCLICEQLNYGETSIYEFFVSSDKREHWNNEWPLRGEEDYSESVSVAER
jgi:hypothetical protein